jgi:hypothetical protein
MKGIPKNSKLAMPSSLRLGKVCKLRYTRSQRRFCVAFLVISASLLFPFCLSTPAAAQEIVAIPDSTRFLKSELSRDTILIGDQIIWSMSTKAEEGSAFLFAIELPKELTKGVELLEAKIDTVRERRSKEWLMRSEMRITSFDSGSYKLPPMPLYLLSPAGRVDTLWFEGPALEVTTIPIDTTTYQPFDIKGQFDYPITVKETLPWAGLLLLILLIAYILYRWIRHRRENRPLFGKPKPKEPAYLVAFRQLEEIKAQKLWQGGKVKLFYTAVTEVLRTYVTARFGIQAMEQTSAEMLEALKAEQLDKALWRELSDMLEIADLAKFAKYEPDASENEQAIPVAVHFVQATMIAEAETETEAKSEEGAAVEPETVPKVDPISDNMEEK